MILTKEGFEKLKRELKNYLLERKEISTRIQSAKELGDLSENAEYSEAKDAQRLNEARISEIQAQIRTAQVIDSLKIRDTIQIGSTVRILSNESEKILKIVGANQSDPVKGLISNESPLGQVLLGRKKGDETEVQLPTKKMTYKILDVS